MDEISIDGLEIDFTSKGEVPKKPPPMVSAPPPPPPPLPGKRSFMVYYVLKCFQTESFKFKQNFVKTFKKETKNSSPPPPSTSITPSRANLLESIRQGTKLKKVTTRQSKPAGNDLMSSLTARLDSRRKVLSDRDRASIQKFPKKKIENSKI